LSTSELKIETNKLVLVCGILTISRKSSFLFLSFNLLINFTVVLVVLMLLFTTVAAQDLSKTVNTSTTTKSLGYKDAYIYVKHLEVGKENGKLIKEVSFNRDVGKFKLISGEIYFCRKFNERVSGLYFEGKGEFSFEPPTKIEQEHLFRFYETKEFKTDFNKLLVLFTDSTYNELKDKIVFGNLSMDQEEVKVEISKRIEYLEDSDVGYTHSDYIRSLLCNVENGFFYAHIEKSISDIVFFQINPFVEEEVSFMRDLRIATHKFREVINQFPAANSYTSKRQSKYFLDILSYRIESTIKDNLDFSAECTIDFAVKSSGQNWITFYLYSDLRVSKIVWEDSSNAKFANMPESPEVWVKIDEKFLDDEQHSFKIYYKGDLLEKNQAGWIELKSSTNWYPRLGNRGKAMFGLIFHTPAEYSFISVGELKRKTMNDDVLNTTWLCEKPYRNCSFSIGKFEKYTLEEKGFPQINVYMSEYGFGHNFPSLSDASESIAVDVVNSISLYRDIFGDIPTKTINLTETPYSHGEAFPGLVHLSWMTYRVANDEGLDEIFRAHEVAHQWWGIGVDFESYHDQWLSEGFAQYSGLWYALVVLDDTERFFEILEEWRDQIIENRSYLISSGQEAGPIWLGYRTNSTATEGDYNLIIYRKGAWVLHMLRTMLLNLETMNEDAFKNMMKEYFSKYFDKKPSTEDFISLVEKHFGMDMAWFFDQYVYGTDVPKYKFAYYTREGDDNKFIVTCRVKQEDVSQDFKNYIPLKIIFDDESFARLRVEITGRQIIFELPPLPAKPEEIIFNDLESILCMVDYESWD
jgi:Peptidase family M1 domain